MSRTYNAPTSNLENYGEGPEQMFFSGNLPEAPAMGYAPPPTVPKPQGASGLEKALGIYAGISGLGGLTQSIGQIAQNLGYDNSFTQGMEKYGGIASNPLKSAIDYYRGTGAFAPSYEDFDSGSAMDDALADAGITGQASRDIAAGGDAGNPTAQTDWAGIAGKGVGYASDLYGIYKGIDEGGAKGYASAAKDAASLAGYDVDGLPVVAGYNIAKDLGKGNYGGAGVTAASAVVPLAGLGFAAAGALNKAFLGSGSKDRNTAAFKAVNPLGMKWADMQSSGIASKVQGGVAVMPNGQFADADWLNDVTGAWYGATYAPDGNQGEWQKKLDDLMANPVYGKGNIPKGFRYDAATNKIVRAAEGGYFSLGPEPEDLFPVQEASQEFSEGGVPFSPLSSGLSTQPRYVQSGPGGGRGDEIDAKLSPKEYVMDAETVALAGDGDPDEGARKLDELRKRLRMHKGKNLAKGKFSHKAKPLHNYLRAK